MVRKCDILKESYPVKQHTVDECAKLLEPDWPETQTELVVIRFFLQPQILFSANLPHCVALPKDQQKFHLLYFLTNLKVVAVYP